MNYKKTIAIHNYFETTFQDKDLIAIADNIILAKSIMRDDWFIINYISHEKHKLSKDEANIIFQDYLNQIVYCVDNPQLNLELKDK